MWTAVDSSTIKLCLTQELQLILATERPSVPIVRMFRLSGDLQPVVMRQALHRVARRHDALRMRFPVELRPDRGVVVDPDRAQWPVMEHDLADLASAEREAELARLIPTLSGPFDLAVDPPVRALIVREAGDGWLFGLTVDHIVTDQQSLDVLVAEIADAYGRELSGVSGDDTPAPSVAEGARAERAYYSGAERDRLVGYWRERFACYGSVMPALSLTVEGSAPERGEAKARQPAPHQLGRLELSASAMGRLRQIAQDHMTTVMTVVLAAFLVALRRWSTRDMVGVRLPVLGRQFPGGESVVGPFAPSLPLWVDVPATAQAPQILAEVADRSLELYDHAVPLSAITDCLGTVAGHDLGSPDGLRRALLVPHVVFLGRTEPPHPLQLAGLRAESIDTVREHLPHLSLPTVLVRLNLGRGEIYLGGGARHCAPHLPRELGVELGRQLDLFRQ